MSVDRLAEVQQAIKIGDREHARKLLSQVLLSKPNDEQAWLLMARLVDTQKQVIDCLEWALKVNPQNSSTRNALRLLKRESSPGSVAGPAQASVSRFGTVTERRLPVAPAIETPLMRITTVSKTERKAILSPHRKINWSLLIGFLIVLGVVLVAFIGPEIAPHDPMEEHSILQVDGKWLIPPFDAFKVPGYLLGSDEFGRDLLSRILYAVRPTLIMVAIVAVVRLFLGTLIGLGAGWSNGRLGRILDSLITAALSVPILMVALGAIAMLGAEIGLSAFIVGLSINGWGETARFVREQTRLVKGQLYIESAHALGASTLRILYQHILRQVMPMIWMLFAFEISGTLMVTAGLGFMGYFIGGDVWVEVRDFVSRRISGTPELGQMLATSWVNLLRPWPLVLTGSVIFITVLGFNLLGDGLRFRLNPEYINRNNLITHLGHRFSLWFEEAISYPIYTWLRANRLRPALVAATVIALAGFTFLLQSVIAEKLGASQFSLTPPGGQIWAAERIDPYGTLLFDPMDLDDPQELWVFNYPAGFSGSPAISADGTLYAAGLDAQLLTINPDGTVLWTLALPEAPMGPVAIGPDGSVYVTDSKGGVSAASPDGTLLWTYSTDVFGRPAHGAIVAPGGTIYYLLEDARGDTLIALQPNGELLWSAKTGTRRADSSLRLSPDSKDIFVTDVVINAEDGNIVDLNLPTQGSAGLAGQQQLFVGSNGKTYLLTGHIVVQWELTSQGFSLVKSADWDYRGIGFYQTSSFPSDASVLPNGNILIFYTNPFGGTYVIWLDESGKFLGWTRAAFRENVRLVAVDKTGIPIICGIGPTDQGAYTTMCQAFEADNDEPLWFYALGVDNMSIAGAALAPGRLYIITMDGNLIALSDAQAPIPTLSP